MGNAAKAAAAIRARELSPLEVVDKCLERIHKLEPVIHAWVTVAGEEARSTAQQRLREAENGIIHGPLHGIPIGVKDIFDVAGLPTRAGAASFAHRVPSTDAAVVTKLKAAGAIVLGKTATTQFAFTDPAPTHNPWNLEHTPGGSSSGSAAGVATGMVPLALGSQTVGSTLRPAAFCGIVGLKPTYSLLSTTGVVPLAWSLDHVGILAGDVDDAALMLQAITGINAFPKAKIPATAGRRPGAPLGQRPTFRLLGWDYEEQASKEMTDHVSGVAHQLAKDQASIEAVDSPPSLAAGLTAGYLVLRSEAAAYHRTSFAEHGEDYRPGIRGLVEAGLATPATEYVLAQHMRGQLRHELTTLLRRFDALLLPVTATPAPHGLENTGVPNPFCAMASFAGLPSIALPSGLSANGLPLAIQLVGAPWQEAKLLRAAAWVEGVLGFKLAPPTLA